MTDVENSKTPSTMGIKWILLFAIILIALFLRLFNLDYMEFKGDEALYLFIVDRFIEDKVFPLTSIPTSVGVTAPPIFVYILSIPYFFSKNPVVLAGFIAILNVIGIFICFIMVKKLFGAKAGLIASAFYAVNPWHVILSRKIWNPDLVAPFAMLFIFFTYKAIFEKKSHYIIFSLIALGVVIQSHFSTLYFIAIFFIITIRYWNNISKKHLLIGSILFIIMFIPYAVYEYKNNFVDIIRLVRLSDQEHISKENVLIAASKYTTTSGFKEIFGNDYDSFERSIYKFSFLDTLQAIILGVSFIFFFIRYEGKLFILLLWLLFGLFSLVFAKVNLTTHYFLHLFPLLFILLGNFFCWLLEARSKIIRHGISAYIIVLLAYQFYFSFNLISFPKDKQCINGDYGPPFSYRVAGVRKAMDEGKKNVDDIQAYCKCVKCDRAATMYIIRYLN